jgi:hypothetical protein
LARGIGSSLGLLDAQEPKARHKARATTRVGRFEIMLEWMSFNGV